MNGPEPRSVSALLGPVAHVAYVTDDVPKMQASMSTAGVQWSYLKHVVARIRDTEGAVQELEVDYVTSANGEPRTKLLTRIAGSIFEFQRHGAVHHLSYWVPDLDAATQELEHVGWQTEATGLDGEDLPAYRYLLAPDGRRIELGLSSRAAEFDAWAEGD